MAIDVKSIIADALLKLCETKGLSKVTIADIQAVSGVSRQTFYNHFKDKRDVIQYIYETRIISHWKTPNADLDYYDAALAAFKNDARYRIFLKQALQMDGANCLVDYMYEYSKKFDLAWHQSLYGSAPMSRELRFASEYHSIAGIQMRIQWIMNDLPYSPEQLLEMIICTRLYSLNELLFNGRDDVSPYLPAARRCGLLNP